MKKKRTRTRSKPRRRAAKPPIPRRPRRQNASSRKRRMVTKKTRQRRGSVQNLKRARVGKRPKRRVATKITVQPRRRRTPRRLKIPVTTGTRTVAIPRGTDASLVGRYWNAVHRYLSRGDATALNRFIGIHITNAQGKRVRLLTDLATLDRLANAGVLSFESIYGRTA